MSEYTTQDYEQIPYQVAELNKQIILLTAENEELKKQVKLKNQFRDYAHKYKNALDEIKEIANTLECDCAIRDILQKIKEVKDNE